MSYHWRSQEITAETFWQSQYNSAFKANLFNLGADENAAKCQQRSTRSFPPTFLFSIFCRSRWRTLQSHHKMATRMTSGYPSSTKQPRLPTCSAIVSSSNFFTVIELSKHKLVLRIHSTCNVSAANSTASVDALGATGKSVASETFCCKTWSQTCLLFE